MNRNQNTQRRAIREEIETVKLKAEDYVEVEWVIDDVNKRMTAQVNAKVPYNLSSTIKGKIGEYIAFLHLNTNINDAETFFQRQKSGYTFDILDTHSGLRYEIKFSPLKTYKGKRAPHWLFHFATNHPGINAQQVSATKYRNDYSTSCDVVLLIGLDKDNGINIFMIPSESPDLNHGCIEIPQSGKSKYSKYRVDITTFSSLFTPIENKN